MAKFNFAEFHFHALRRIERTTTGALCSPEPSDPVVYPPVSPCGEATGLDWDEPLWRK